MEKCATIPFVPEFSGCLVEKPSCGFAVRCGFSYHCEHPKHTKFHAGEDTRITRLSRYNELKESRRLQYQAEMQNNDENAFYFEKKYLKPITAIEQDRGSGALPDADVTVR